MDQKEQMKQNLIEEINIYYEHYTYMADVMAVHDHIKHFYDYERNKLETAFNFFCIANAATYDSCILSLARLYDNSEKSKNIANLILKCKKNIFLFNNDKEVESKLIEFEEKMNNDTIVSPAINIIKYRRDKIFAHNDKKFFAHPENDDSYLPMYALWILRNFTKEVLSYLLKALGEKPIKETIYDNDLNNLLVKDSNNM